MDLIDRQAAIDVVRKAIGIVSPISDDIILVDKAEVQTELMMLPSAERKGKWISGKDVPNRNPYEHLADAMYCSECLTEAYWDCDYGQQMFDFCPYCGAKMERGEE